MSRFVSIAIVLLAAAGILLARGGMISDEPRPAEPAEGEKKIIDLKSDLSGPVAPGDSVIFLIGNFAAQHNGAVITCDSAVRYSDKHIEFFGNVLINKNTTYIYGDRADYNGERNEARVYSDLVKVVDGDATLYTYEFLFNTKSNIGEFGGGGILTNRENRLEAVRGYYYADTKELICVDEVQMRNDEYDLTGDSVVYDMATDNAFFFENTNIWNAEGNYLYADRGSYVKADSLYKVTRNGYVLTDKQEMWSDSIDYFRSEEHVVLRRDIQIDDTEHKVLAFGDYGEYWKEPGNAFLTRRPSVVSYDLSQGDSLYSRADTMYLLTIVGGRDALPEQIGAADSAAMVSAAEADSTAVRERPSGADSTGRRPSRRDVPRSQADAQVRDSLSGEPVAADSLGRSLPDSPGGADSLAGADSSVPEVDSLAADTVQLTTADTVQLTAAERKAQLKEAARKARAEMKAAKEAARKKLLDSIAVKRQEKATAKLLAQKEKEEARLAAQRLKVESKMKARQARAARRGKLIPVDSGVLHRLDSLIEVNMEEQDSLLGLLVDSLLADTVAAVQPADTVDSVALRADSMYRLVKGFRNVRIYRSDFQAVCDSLVGISTDSTIHLYIDPVLWNQSNQITSEVMDIFTKNKQLDRAEFVGSPMMVGQLDTAHYNQVAGKSMTAYFHDNQIARNDVNGNAQTIYYMQDGEPPEIVMLGVIESGEISFYIEDKQVVQITYRGDPVYNFYPMNKIPPDQELFLQGFRWEGARRPSKADVFDRRIRPSEREERSSMPRPAFPIMERIGEHRTKLVEEGRWADRNDQVDAATVEWMHSLGYEVGQPRDAEREPAGEPEAGAGE